jgi:glycerol-1-phosphatase
VTRPGSTDGPLVDQHDLLLSDLDGVVYRGEQPVAYAAESLVRARSSGAAVLFVTNNASREPQTVADQLTALGVTTAADEVVTSAQAAAATLRARLGEGAKVLVVGAAGLLSAVEAEGLVPVENAGENPVAVVQGFGPQLGWQDLAEAAYAVGAGAWYVATNLDMSLPTARGTAPGNGALVGAVVAATGVSPEGCGKPAPTMYLTGIDRVGARRPLVVGDRLDTDIVGACTAGIPSLLVLTGVSTGRDAVLAPSWSRPTYLAEDLRSLHEPHPAPQETDAGWVCGPASARIVGGRLELSGTSGIDMLRAACAAVWTAVDQGGAVDPATVPDLGPW